MRNFLLLLLLALTSVSFAKKDHTMKIKVLSYETKEPLANIHIEIRGKKSTLLNVILIPADKRHIPGKEN